MKVKYIAPMTEIIDITMQREVLSLSDGTLTGVSAADLTEDDYSSVTGW